MRLSLQDSLIELLTKMSEGNPGAVTALMDMFNKGHEIDPDNAFKGYGPLILLDEYGIYGADINVLWSDLCGKSTPITLAVLRAVQLGYLDRAVLKDACSRQDYSGREVFTLEYIQELCDNIKEKLPNFNLEKQE
jgi:hypothetical protein